jgi:hypothetical protein
MKKLLGIVVLGLLLIVETNAATNTLGNLNKKIYLKDKIKKYYKLQLVPDCIIPKKIDVQYHSKWNNCFGELKNVKGELYIGEWKNGKPDGLGTFYVDYDNDKLWRYEGSWKNGEFSGRGVFVEDSRKTYIGEFKNNKRHGKGTLIWPNGSARDVTYENDEIVNFWNNASFEKRAKAKKNYLTIPEKDRSLCDLYIGKSKLIKNVSILNKSYEKYDLKVAGNNGVIAFCLYSESYKSVKNVGDKHRLGDLGHPKTPMLTIQINPIHNSAWFSKNLSGSASGMGTCFWPDNSYQHNVDVNKCYGKPY